jgi:InsA N-terminal domain
MSTIPISCPNCQSVSTRGNGQTSSGTQRYRCNECNKSFTFTVVGRPLLGDRPLTSYERVKRARAKKRAEIQGINPHSKDSI